MSLEGRRILSGLIGVSPPTSEIPFSVGTLPVSPIDGQCVTYIPSVGYPDRKSQLFKYWADSPFEHKWEAIGAKEFFWYDSTQAEITADMAGWQALPGLGAGIQVPLTGTYDVRFSYYTWNASDSPNFLIVAPYNGVSVSTADYGATHGLLPLESQTIYTGAPVDFVAGNYYTLRFLNLGGTATFGGIKLWLSPIRVSG